jgi:hypothetical protein
MDTKVTYIDRHDSLRPVGPQATQSLLDEKKIPALQEHEYQQWAEYLFSAPLPLLVTVAETVFRYDRQHPRALTLFLACAVPLAKRTARRLTRKTSPDLIEELMYDGAFNNALDLFQTHHNLEVTSPFRPLLYCALKTGALRPFERMENTHVASFGTTDGHPAGPRLIEQLIAKQMLEKIANLEPSPETPLHLYNFLRCLILQIGPDNALRPRTKSKNQPRPSPIIDFEPLMKALGISRRSARHYLQMARPILKKLFNQDGTLFTRAAPR